MMTKSYNICKLKKKKYYHYFIAHSKIFPTYKKTEVHSVSKIT